MRHSCRHAQVSSDASCLHRTPLVLGTDGLALTARPDAAMEARARGAPCPVGTGRRSATTRRPSEGRALRRVTCASTGPARRRRGRSVVGPLQGPWWSLCTVHGDIARWWPTGGGDLSNAAGATALRCFGVGSEQHSSPRRQPPTLPLAEGVSIGPATGRRAPWGAQRVLGGQCSCSSTMMGAWMTRSWFQGSSSMTFWVLRRVGRVSCP